MTAVKHYRPFASGAFFGGSQRMGRDRDDVIRRTASATWGTRQEIACRPMNHAPP